jgi:hypothetical protein
MGRRLVVEKFFSEGLHNRQDQLYSSNKLYSTVLVGCHHNSKLSSNNLGHKFGKSGAS